MESGKKITIIAPSGAIEPSLIDGAADVLRSWGHNVKISANAKGKLNRFSASDAERIADLQEAINDPWSNVILCARGGYGLSRIVDKIDFLPLLKNFKLFIGFSDITAIHNALSKLGIVSVHGPMAKHIALEPNSPAVKMLKEVLSGAEIHYCYNNLITQAKCLSAEGVLVGGNLSILYALRGTPFDLEYRGKILFIEDIGERLYHIDRMVQNFRMGGVFDSISGLIVGQFTDCDEDTSFPDGAYGIIADSIKGLDIPVAWNFPAGHIDNENMPLLFGAKYRLNVKTLPQQFSLDQIAY